MLCMYMHTCVDMYHDTVVLALHLLLKVLITVIVGTTRGGAVNVI
jgi:hypothetical protein